MPTPPWVAKQAQPYGGGSPATSQRRTPDQSAGSCASLANAGSADRSTVGVVGDDQPKSFVEEWAPSILFAVVLVIVILMLMLAGFVWVATAS